MVQLEVGETIYLPGIIDGLIITKKTDKYYVFSTEKNPSLSVLHAGKDYVDEHATERCGPVCTMMGGKRKSRKNRKSRKSHRRRN
jgi:hypothetical protein